MESTTLVGTEKMCKENRPNYYNFLQIPTDATDSMIRTAYRSKSLLYHPDKDPTKAFEWKLLCDAYKILLDPELKADYDLLLFTDEDSFSLPPLEASFESNSVLFPNTSCSPARTAESYDYTPPEEPSVNTDTTTVRDMAALLEEIRNPKPAPIILSPPPQPVPSSFPVKNPEECQSSTVNKDIEAAAVKQMQRKLESLLRGESLNEEQEEQQQLQKNNEAEQHENEEEKAAEGKHDEDVEIEDDHDNESKQQQLTLEKNVTEELEVDTKEEDGLNSHTYNSDRQKSAEEEDKSATETTDTEEQRPKAKKKEKTKKSKRRSHQSLHPLEDLDGWSEGCEYSAASVAWKSTRTSDPAKPPIEDELWKVTQYLDRILAECGRKSFEEEEIPDVGKDKKLKLIHRKLKSIADSMKVQMPRQSRFNFLGWNFSVSPTKFH